MTGHMLGAASAVEGIVIGSILFLIKKFMRLKMCLKKIPESF
jgi:3-oxoacyl-(acyl-carrier-protein) synthase